MTPEQVLHHAPNILTVKQRETFFAEGYLCLPEFVSEPLLSRLRAASSAAVERSRSLGCLEHGILPESGSHFANTATESAVPRK